MELNEKTVAELKEIANGLGISTTGLKKDELIAAINEAQATEPSPQEEPVITEKSERMRLVYIGPTLPGGILSRGAMLVGTQQSIADYIAPATQKFPTAAKLLVPLKDAKGGLQMIRERKGALYKYAQEVMREGGN